MLAHYHHDDLPEGLALGNLVAVDTETMGLNPWRDRLCVVQLSAGDGVCHVVHLHGDYAAPRLRALLADPLVTKIFHFARFDVAMISRWLGIVCSPVYCTKIASKLIRTNVERHGLKDVCRDLLGIEVSKQQQSSDWGVAELSPAQVDYAAGDVLHLHALKRQLDILLVREGRYDLAMACFAFMPHRAALDLGGWADESDIFAH
ncbi:MAG: ribonuclease D [Alphaproteobacteria bacterium]|nr:ribonuclease D [Alphaproteobacteria bacterium]